MRRFVDILQTWNFRMCGIFIVDSHFMVDGATFLSGTMSALSVMVNLEIPHVNILSKIDLLSPQGMYVSIIFVNLFLISNSPQCEKKIIFLIFQQRNK